MGGVSFEDLWVCKDDFTSAEATTMQVLGLAFAVFSVMGASFVCVHFLLWSAGLVISRLVFFLAVGDLMGGLAIIVSNASVMATDVPWYPCLMMRLVFEYFYTSTFFVTACIAVYLLISVTFDAPVMQTEDVVFDEHASVAESVRDVGGGIYASISSQTSSISSVLSEFARRSASKIVNGIFSSSPNPTAALVGSFVFSFGIPVVFIAALLSNRLYARTSIGWCHPKPPYGIYLWLLPMGVVFVFNLLVYIYLMWKVTSKLSWSRGRGTQKMQNRFGLIIARRIALFLLVYCVCWLPDVTAHILGFTDKSCHMFWLDVLTSLATLQGFLDMLVYTVANPTVRQQYSWWKLLLHIIVSPFLLVPALLVVTYYRISVVLRCCIGVQLPGYNRFLAGGTVVTTTAYQPAPYSPGRKTPFSFQVNAGRGDDGSVLYVDDRGYEDEGRDTDEYAYEPILSDSSEGMARLLDGAHMSPYGI